MEYFLLVSEQISGGWQSVRSNNLQRLHRRGRLQFYAFYCPANGCSTDHKCNKLRKSAGKKSNLSILCRPSAILELCTFMIIISNGKTHIKHINEDLTHISTFISLPYKANVLLKISSQGSNYGRNESVRILTDIPIYLYR